MKTLFKKLRSFKFSRGMTYVELIVVLTIFSTMTAVAMFNHNKFQDKVSIKNLANDIALRLVEAQKSSVGGKWNVEAQYNWKPSYGVHFNLAGLGNNQSFIYFADFDGNKLYGGPLPCAVPTTQGDECLDSISLTRGNIISAMTFFYTDGTTSSPTNLTVTFTRPSSSASIVSVPPPASTISYAEITVVSPSALTAKIKVYPSGRIQIN